MTDKQEHARARAEAVHYLTQAQQRLDNLTTTINALMREEEDAARQLEIAEHRLAMLTEESDD